METTMEVFISCRSSTMTEEKMWQRTKQKKCRKKDFVFAPFLNHTLRVFFFLLESYSACFLKNKIEIQNNNTHAQAHHYFSHTHRHINT